MWTKLPWFKTHGHTTLEFLKKEQEKYVIIPHEDHIFKPLRMVKPSEVKVVIINYEPESNGTSHGLAHSLPFGERPSKIHTCLREEVCSNFRWKLPRHYDLHTWAMNGVLLWNIRPTVRLGQPGSHINKGWEKLTYDIVATLCRRKNPIVFMLWGIGFKNIKAQLSHHPHHLVLCSHNPAITNLPDIYDIPVFKGSQHFKKACDFLDINPEQLWRLP